MNVKILLIAIVAAAALATAANFDLMLKCAALQLYVNATKANITLPSCDALNKTVVVVKTAGGPLPMIGVGELRHLNASRDIFSQIKAIRRAALENLTRHAERAVILAYRSFNNTENIEAAVSGVDRGINTLIRVRDLLSKVNASREAIRAIEDNIKWLNLTRRVIAGRPEDFINLTAIRNVTNIEDVEKILERQREELKQLLDRFEKIKIAGLPRALIQERWDWLNKTATWMKDPAVRSQIIKAIREGKLPDLVKEVVSRGPPAPRGQSKKP